MADPSMLRDLLGLAPLADSGVRWKEKVKEYCATQRSGSSNSPCRHDEEAATRRVGGLADQRDDLARVKQYQTKHSTAAGKKGRKLQT